MGEWMRLRISTLDQLTIGSRLFRRTHKYEIQTLTEKTFNKSRSQMKIKSPSSKNCIPMNPLDEFS